MRKDNKAMLETKRSNKHFMKFMLGVCQIFVCQMFVEKYQVLSPFY